MKLNLLIVLIVLVFTVTQAKKQKKWRPPLEFGPKTTSIYSSIQRSNRRKINVDLLDPNDDRTRPPRAKLSGTSYKPGTYNWYPNMDIPKYSYRFRIFNLTKDQAGSYVGMHYDYRKNYGPLYNTRFGGTYPPIPPLLGDPRQPRLSWYLKKYTPPTPPANYIDHIMDVIKDGQTRDKLYEKQLEPENKKRVSAEWFTVRPKNESNYYYPEEKVKPRFGDYGGIALEDAFPAYVPKEPYEVVMVPDRQPIYKRSVETSIGDLIKTVERDTHGNIINKDEPRGNDDDSNEEFSEDDVPPGKKLDKAPDQKRAKSESYSSNSYSYEQFDSRESIAVPFTAEKQFSSSSSSSSEETKSKKTKQSRKKRSEDKSDKVTSEYSEVPDPYSKSESFPAPLNTGESGWGAKPPASKSTESGSENSSEKKTGRKKRSEQSGYPDHPYPRMKIEDDSEKERVSSGLENESFPSASSNAHSSDMVLWDAMRNYSEEFKSISSTSELVSSGSLSKYNSESESESAEEDDTNKDPQNKKDDGKTSKSAKKNDGKTSKNAKRGDNKTSENFKKNDGKTSTKNSVNGNGKKGNVGMPARNSHALKFDDKTSKKEESKKESGSNYDSNDDNPWGDISYVEEVTVDPPHLRTFPPTFTEQYVAPLHHQPDDFWDEIYRPDGPDPTLYPWQEEEIRNQETTWLPPIITTRDPTSKPKFIYVTNEDTASDDDKILESSEQKDKELPKQHNLGLTKKQLQLRKILKLKNKAKHLNKLNSKFKLHGIAKSGIDVKGKDKGRKEKKKPKKKDKEKKNNPNNFSRPNPDHLKVQGKFENQPVIGDPLHGVPKKGNVIGDPYNDAHKGVNKIQDPYLNDPRKIHAAVKPFGLDQSLSNGINVKGKDKGRKEKKKPKKKDKEKKNNPNNFSRPNPDHLKVQGKLENQPVIGDPYSNAHKGVKKIQDPFNDPRKIYAAVTPFEPDYSFSESRPEGNYEWPSLIHPKLNPETAYDDEGFPIHESPDWTSPTTHKKDRIFGKERAKMANGVRGRGINMQQYMKKITEKGQPHPEMIHKGAKFQVTPDPHIPHPQQELVHNSNGIGHDIKDKLQVPKIKDMKMTKDFVAAHNIDNLQRIQVQPLVQARHKRNVNAPPSSSFSGGTELKQSQGTQSSALLDKEGYMNENTMYTRSSGFPHHHATYSESSTFGSTSPRPPFGSNVTRNPFIVSEYNGNYNQKWGFTKKLNYRSRPPWWTRAPFYVTRGMFDAPPGYVHPPGPTKLFWPGFRAYRRLGPELPKSTYPPVWFRTGRTNFPHTLPPQQEIENKTEVVVIPQYRHIDSFELDTDPVPTAKIRTGRTRFPHTVYPFIKEALWGKVKPEDREAFTYPAKWLFDDMNDDFLLRSEEVTEPYKPIEAKAATAWMDSSLFSETTLERPDKDKDSFEENFNKKRPTYPPVWIRTGRTIIPRNVPTFIKKALWGKVKPEDRESFTTNPIWMLDYEDFLLAEIPTDEPTTLQPTPVPTQPQIASTLHTAPWWTYPAYWIKLHPHLNVTERITSPEPPLEEGPAEWTRPPGVPELCPPEELPTTRRSFVFEILEKRKKGVTDKIGIKNTVIKESTTKLSLYEANRRFLNEPPRYGHHSPPYGSEYPRSDIRNYNSRDTGPKYNQEFPRQFRDRPRYDRGNNPRYGRGNSRFSGQNHRYGRRPGHNTHYGRGENNEEQNVTHRKRFRYRPKRSTSALDNPLFHFLFNKFKSPIVIENYTVTESSTDFKNSENKNRPVKFRPETLWENLGKENVLMKNHSKTLIYTVNNDYIKINNVRDSVNNNSFLGYKLEEKFGKYILGSTTKMIGKRFVDDDYFKELKKNKFPNFDKYKKQKKGEQADFDYYDKLDEYLQKMQDESSSSGSGSQSLSSLARSFEKEENWSDESSDYSFTPTPSNVKTTKFKWVQRKWAGLALDKSESDLSVLKEPTTYFPKIKTIPRQRVRRERATKAPKIIRVPFKRTVLRRTTPRENLNRRKRDIYDDIDTTESDPFFEAWLKSKREEEERERFLFGMEYGLTTPEPAKVVSKRSGRTRVLWVAKTKRPKVYVVPFTLPDRLRKKSVTLKGGKKTRGRRKKSEANGVQLPFLTTLKPIVIEVTEQPGYFKFGKRIYWLTPRTTYKPTWLRPRRLKPLTTATTTELPSPKFATLVNIHRRTEKPTTPTVKRRRSYRARTFRTLRKIVFTKKSSSSGSDFESDDMEDVDETIEDSSVVDDDEPQRRTFPTLKLPRRKKQEVISFREYLQRRENKIREKEENMWNAQFTPESEEDSAETTTVPVMTLPPVETALPTIIPTLPTSTLQTLHYTLQPTVLNMTPVKKYHSFEYSTPSVKEQTTLSVSTPKKTRRPYRSRKPRATRMSRATNSKRGRARRLSDFENVFPTITSSFSDIGRTKRELLTPENERFEITTEGSVKAMDSVVEMLNKQQNTLSKELDSGAEVMRVKRDVTEEEVTTDPTTAEEVDFVIERVTTEEPLFPSFGELQVIKDLKRSILKKKHKLENAVLYILSYVAAVYHYFRKCFKPR